ncbi:MAG: hypothetical protein HZC36_13390 [Armatimonadetes bacterium]|nr:hypothetical protein [Armatimonadota bacterium]
MTPSSEPEDLCIRVAILLGNRNRYRARFDAETLIGFYRYFDFPKDEVVRAFGDYAPNVVEKGWRVISEYFGDGGAGVAAMLKPPKRWL